MEQGCGTRGVQDAEEAKACASEEAVKQHHIQFESVLFEWRWFHARDSRTSSVFRLQLPVPVLHNPPTPQFAFSPCAYQCVANTHSACTGRWCCSRGRGRGIGSLSTHCRCIPGRACRTWWTCHYTVTVAFCAKVDEARVVVVREQRAQTMVCSTATSTCATLYVTPLCRQGVQSMQRESTCTVKITPRRPPTR